MRTHGQSDKHTHTDRLAIW